jgi:hypothetical protein
MGDGVSRHAGAIDGNRDVNEYRERKVITV